MPHPLADLDGQRKHIFTKSGEKFYLRVVTSESELQKHQDAIRFLMPIMYQSQVEMQHYLDSKNEKLKKSPIPPIPERMKHFSENVFATNMGKDDNQTVLMIENEKGEFAVGMLLTINDLKQRESLQVPQDVGTFVYVQSLVTREEFRGQNLFSSGLDKFLTMIANPKRQILTPIMHSVSVSTVTAVKENGEEKEYVMNLARYSAMWQKRLQENHVQNRHQDQKGDQFGLERMPLDVILDDEGKFDEEKIHQLVSDQKTKVAEGMHVRGYYLEGKSPSYDEIKKTRKKILEEKSQAGFGRDKTTKEKWQKYDRPQDVIEAGVASSLKMFTRNSSK